MDGSGGDAAYPASLSTTDEVIDGRAGINHSR